MKDFFKFILLLIIYTIIGNCIYFSIYPPILTPEIYKHNFTSITDELIFVLNKHKTNVTYDANISDYNMRSTVEVKCQVKGVRYVLCVTAAKGIPDANNMINKEIVLYDDKMIDFLFISPFNALLSKINNPQGVMISKAIEGNINQITVSDEKQGEVFKIGYTDDLIVTYVKKYKNNNLYVEAYFKNWVFLKNDI